MCSVTGFIPSVAFSPCCVCQLIENRARMRGSRCWIQDIWKCVAACSLERTDCVWTPIHANEYARHATARAPESIAGSDIYSQDRESGCARLASCNANDWRICAGVVLDQQSNLSGFSFNLSLLFLPLLSSHLYLFSSLLFASVLWRVLCCVVVCCCVSLCCVCVRVCVCRCVMCLELNSVSR